MEGKPQALRGRKEQVVGMVFFDEANWHSYLDCVSDLLASPEVQSMRTIPHHPGTCCYEHSVFVSYVAFRLARRWGLDCRTAARGGLLHDLYLYDAHDHSNYKGNQCFAHPRAAAKNAAVLCGGLSEKEENIILSHMWPLSRRMPHCGEAYVVNLADKLCATAEVARIWRRMKLRRAVFEASAA